MENNPVPSLQILIAVLSIVGAGISAWIGVKVALAQIQRDIQGLQKEDEALCERIERLEAPYFRDKN